MVPAASLDRWFQCLPSLQPLLGRQLPSAHLRWSSLVSRWDCHLKFLREEHGLEPLPSSMLGSWWPISSLSTGADGPRGHPPHCFRNSSGARVKL